MENNLARVGLRLTSYLYNVFVIFCNVIEQLSCLFIDLHYRSLTIIFFLAYINNCILQEIENLTFIKDSLSRSDHMTQQMLGILDAFGQRLSRLEETIMPIYEKTESLQRKHESILSHVSLRVCEAVSLVR